MSAGARLRAPFVLMLAVLGGLCSAAAAQADFASDSPVGSPRLTLALSLGEQHWGTTPCSGQFAVAWTAQSPQVNAVSRWSNPFDAYLQPTLNADCSIELNPSATWDWPKFCTVMVHEIGHLDGQPHVDDPNNVMSPVYTRPVAECTVHADPQAPEPIAQVTVATPSFTPAAGLRPRVTLKRVPRVRHTSRPSRKAARGRPTKRATRSVQP